MVSKIKTYLKFVVCTILIFGLLAPSYAAMSSSDGSAFITKAEFDSALSDFNARLTTFEAGINSKIDSQVSSYLDRNGIWMPKEVTSVTLKETTLFKIENQSGGNAFTAYNYAGSAMELAFKYLQSDPPVYYNAQYDCFVANKAGLCNFVFNFKPYISCSSFWQSRGYIYQDDNWIDISYNFNIVDKATGDVKNTYIWSWLKAICTTNGGSGSYYCLGSVGSINYSPASLSMNFFVENGKTYQIQWEFSGHYVGPYFWTGGNCSLYAQPDTSKCSVKIY